MSLLYTILNVLSLAVWLELSVCACGGRAHNSYIAMALTIFQLVVQLIGRLVLEINPRCNGCLVCFLISYIFAVFYGELRPIGDIAEDKYVEQYVERLSSPIVFMCLVWVMNTFMDVLDALRVRYTTIWILGGLAPCRIRNVFLFICKPLHFNFFERLHSGDERRGV